MCGRVVHKTPLGEIRVMFETVQSAAQFRGQLQRRADGRAAVVRLDREHRRCLDLLRWGLIPYWAKDKSIGPRCITRSPRRSRASRHSAKRPSGRGCMVPPDRLRHMLML
jgi:putative SOS response-associated peptidase YedK